LPAGWVTVKVSVETPPTATVVGAKALVRTGVAAVVVTHAPAVGTTPLVALGVMAAVAFVNPVMLLFWLVFAFGTIVQAPSVGVSEEVIGTMIVQVAVAAIVLLPATLIVFVPAVAVIVPPVHVPDTTLGVAMSKPAGSVSIKVKATEGFATGCVIVNVRFVEPPKTKSPANTLFTVGTPGRIVTHAPVVELPLVAELLTAAVIFVVLTIFEFPLVFAACGHAPMVGAAMVVTGTMMVQVVAGLTI
jgi:hypothetical protein